MFVMQLKTAFDGAICTLLQNMHLQWQYDEIRVQFISQLDGKIGHLSKTLCPFFPKPFVHLLSAKGRFTHLLKGVNGFFLAEFPYVSRGTHFLLFAEKQTYRNTS
jgi:hypothetical protein